MAVVAPAGPAPAGRLSRGLARLSERYQVLTCYDPTRPPDRLPYLAASDLARAEELNRWLADERVSAIFCARGGYGCSRILPLLDAPRLASRRLPLIGFSDITVLHAWANNLGVPTIHGPVVTQLADLPAEDHDALFSLLERGHLDPLEGLQRIAGGAATGPLVGGNLSLLSHLCGTEHLPPLDGAVLLLEDVGEAPYRIDRKLTHLAQAGVFDRVAGVLLGDFVDCDDARTSALAVIADRLGASPVPVAAGAPVGHGRRNRALPLGVRIRLDADAGRLELSDHTPAGA